jgi:parallel beta helix pectate lyase-like protein
VVISRVLLAVALLVLLAGCSGDAPATTEPPELAGCTDPLELALPDGSCIRPGITPEGCAPGFVHDGEYGCEPLLPEEPCPKGLMAVPGESECRAVMPCGAGTWGDIAVDATTEYVDGTYRGGLNDGSEARPWTTIQEAVTAAAAGGLIAIAAGTYSEDVLVASKPVRLEGVCPEKVIIMGTGQEATDCAAAALCIRDTAAGTEVRGVSLSGAGRGVFVSYTDQLLIDQVHVHDAAFRGIVVQDLLGPITVRGSLIEHNHEIGLFFADADASIEASVVRATLPREADQAFGRGIVIQLDCSETPTGVVCDPAARSSATITGSVVEQNHDIGLLVGASDARVEGSVVRTTQPDASGEGGFGIDITESCFDTATGVTCDPASRASAVVRGSWIDQNHAAGIFVSASDASVEASVVRDTSPSSVEDGRGISVQGCGPDTGCATEGRANVNVIGSLVQNNHGAGVAISDADAIVERLVVRSNSPIEPPRAHGISVNPSCTNAPGGGITCNPALRANATITGSLIEHTHEVGLLIAGSDANVEASIIRATSPRPGDGLYGDGVVVASFFGPAGATITRSRIDDSARAGLSSFGAFVALGSTHIRCAGIPLTGDPFDGQTFVLEDRGDNRCGCPSADGPCRSVSAGLEPPQPLPPVP